MTVPRQTLAELETSGSMTGSRFLIVEGPSDVSILERLSYELKWNLVPLAVDDVDLESLGQDCCISQRGNRSKLALSAASAPESCNVRFLIDRDLGIHNVEESTALLVTDFPAIESYCVTAPLFGRLLIVLKIFEPDSRLDAAGRRAALDEFVETVMRQLAAYLAPLYRLRKHHARSPSRAFVEELRRYRKAGTNELDVEKIELELSLASGSGTGDIPQTFESLRPVAYGHDIARSLWAMWPNLRHQRNVRSADELEKTLLTLIRPEELLAFPLFQVLEEWTGSAT